MRVGLWAVWIMVALSIVGVVGDVYLKKASAFERPFLSANFLVGLALYSATAFGWALAMKHLKMAAVGAIYSVSTVLLLAVSGALFFNERLTTAEWLGIGLAITSLALLSSR